MGVLYLATDRPERAAEVLSGLVERLPNDASAHRLLGIAHLNRRKFGAAVKHFEIALGLLRREAATERGLYEALRIQCQAALLRLLLVQLHVRLGHAEAARFLVEEGRTL
jgi:tetratricopeptide (TPR) repeat protein